MNQIQRSAIPMSVSGLRLRLVLWAIASVFVSIVFFKAYFLSLPAMLSPSQVLGQNQASPWGVLTLCILFLIVKRKQIFSGMQSETNPGTQAAFIILGAAITVSALLMKVSTDFLTFRMLLAMLGIFIAAFGKAIKLPVILMAIYGFTISFPLLVSSFWQGPYTQTVVLPLKIILDTLGYTFSTDGQLLHLTTQNGQVISALLSFACAGPSTMGVYFAIFALMTLDMPLPFKKAIGLFLFGIFGTWLQNLIRVAILMVVGYYWGEKALWSVHSWTIYVVFPLWYLIFIAIYFRQFNQPKHLDMREGITSRGVQV